MRSGRSLSRTSKPERDELEAAARAGHEDRRGAAVGCAEHLVASFGHELVPLGDVHVVEREEAHGRMLAIDLVEAGGLERALDADRCPRAARIEVQGVGLRAARRE